jgi:hypothetical protein
MENSAVIILVVGLFLLLLPLHNPVAGMTLYALLLLALAGSVILGSKTAIHEVTAAVLFVGAGVCAGIGGLAKAADRRHLELIKHLTADRAPTAQPPAESSRRGSYGGVDYDLSPLNSATQAAQLGQAKAKQPPDHSRAERPARRLSWTVVAALVGLALLVGTALGVVSLHKPNSVPETRDAMCRRVYAPSLQDWCNEELPGG